MTSSPGFSFIQQCPVRILDNTSTRLFSLPAALFFSNEMRGLLRAGH